MKLLVVMPRYHSGSKPDYHYVYPLGIGYVTAVLKRAGHHVDCVNLNHLAGPVDEILIPFLTSSPEPYDFVLTGATSVYYTQVKAVVEAVRRSGTPTKTMVGGGLISSEPSLMMEALAANYLLLGEAEVTVLELLEKVARSESVAEVAGLGYRDASGQFVMTPTRKPIRDLDALPLPDLDAFDFAKTLDHMRPTDNILYGPFDQPRSYPLLTSRSCPYLCTFCFHPIGNVYRQRSLDSIMQELERHIPKYRINIISVYDELFSQDKERLREFCRRFKVFRTTLGWECLWTCSMRVGDVDAELLALMKEAGCHIISYGFESFSASILQSMRKRTTPEQIKRAVELTLQANISVLGNFIFGDTAETLETAQITLDYWKLCGAAAINLNFIIPFPGTTIYTRCVERGLIKDRLKFIETDMLSGPMNCTDGLSDRQFYHLQASVLQARLKYNRMVYPRTRRISSDKSVCDVELQCPFCNAVMMYKNCALVPSWGSFDIHCRCCSHHFFMVTRAGFWAGRIAAGLLNLLPSGGGAWVAQCLLRLRSGMND